MKGVAHSLRLFFLLAVLLIFQNAKSQQAHYIYIQSENNQPYYVQVHGNTYSSNETGYLLIPQLARGEYTILIGFPKRTIEYNFNFLMADDDRGFSLKQGVDNSWSLFDMVSFSVVRGVQVKEKAMEAKEVKEVVSTPVVTEPKKVMEADVPVTVTAGVNAVPEAKTKKAVKLPPVQKIYEKIGSEGIDQVYVVQNGNRSDTVILFIPDLTDTTGNKDPAAFNQRNKEELAALDQPAIAPAALNRCKVMFPAAK